MVEKGQKPGEIDNQVIVDDSKAIRGFKVLEREIARKINIRNLINMVIPTRCG